jgi:hypothetical protein
MDSAMSETDWRALPADGEAVIAGVRLPGGRRLTGVREVRPRSWAPAVWATDPFDGAPETWLALRSALGGSGFGASSGDRGLVPLLLSDLDGQPGRPWESGDLLRPAADPHSGLDAAALLGRLWDASVPDPAEDDEETAEVLDPFSRPFPGLAPAAEGRASATALREAAGSLDGPLRIGLALAGRPADALVAMGWTGAVNSYDSPATLTAVLRSWEDRFGATLMRVGFDLLDLLVERPPATGTDALAVSAEHFACCPDNVYQGAGSIREYAAELPGSARWAFWWD